MYSKIPQNNWYLYLFARYIPTYRVLAMRGMWTKQYTTEGKAYYFNATTNQALWQAPSDSTVHEAEKLVNPSTLSAEDLEKYKNDKAILALDPEQILQTTASTAESTAPSVANTTAPLGTTDSGSSSQVADSSLAQPHFITPEEMQERINAVASQKHQELLHQQKSGTKNKRFQSKQSSQAEETTEYQKMVSSYTAQSGMKSDDGGKWLVR